jgi:3-phenylpropionate/trans-cinnamate dioxygenase ferredoxin reductase subunit
MSTPGIVILGAGQAGLQCAASLREGGYDGAITLLGAEPYLPYQRPPLSKAVLLGTQDSVAVTLRDAAWFTDQRIGLRLGVRATGIDRTARSLATGAGAVAYDRLVLATGARARPLSLAGADLPGVHQLRGLDDALALRTALAAAASVVVIGGGFIGLEVAAVAARLGKRVCVLEAGDRLMARAVSPAISAAFLALHRNAGTEVLLGARLAAIEGADHAAGVRLVDGTRIGADLVLLGVGSVPATELAEAAGLPCPNGVLVDAHMSTADANVLAIGDVALHPNPHAGGLVRLESVQGAVDQAKCAAATLLGRPVAYAALPWFWSDQFDTKLQIAGLARTHDQAVLRGSPESGRFSVFLYAKRQLVAVESVNRPAEHMQARRLLSAGRNVPPEHAADTLFDLKGWAA